MIQTSVSNILDKDVLSDRRLIAVSIGLESNKPDIRQKWRWNVSAQSEMAKFCFFALWWAVWKKWYIVNAETAETESKLSVGLFRFGLSTFQYWKKKLTFCRSLLYQLGGCICSYAHHGRLLSSEMKETLSFFSLVPFSLFYSRWGLSTKTNKIKGTRM